MKTILLACAVTASLSAPAFAQSYQTEAREGVRYLVPKDEATQTEYANLIQSRAIEMGFFSWPMVTEKVAADQANRPRQVSNCSGHDADYKPAHEFTGADDWRLSNIGSAKAFIYEWMAYDNAIKAKDCTCDALKADWPTAVSSFDTLTEGVENFRLYTGVPGRMRDQIKRDYDLMCDVTMLLELE